MYLLVSEDFWEVQLISMINYLDYKIWKIKQQFLKRAVY